MSAPSTPATWDSNNTNATAPTGGHQTDGWAIDEVPTSTEMNGWQRVVALWIAFLAGLAAAVTRNANACCCSVSNGATLSPAQCDLSTFSGVVGHVTDGTIIAYSLDLPAGAVITEVHYRRIGDGVHTLSVTLRTDNGDGTTPAQDGDGGSVPSAAWATTSHVLSSPVTVAAGKSYIVEVVMAAGSTTAKVSSVGATVLLAG